MLRIGLGFERLFFFVLVFFLALHLAACFWLITASIIAEDDEEGTQQMFKGTWMEDYKKKKFEN